jgi:hypothetical protein
MYSAIQRRYFARELARSGGNIAAAAKALRNEYEDLRELAENTLRRFLREKGSAEMIAEEARWLIQIEYEVATQREKDRLERERSGSEMERLARDESILDDLRTMVARSIEELAKSGQELPVKQVADLYERLTKIQDARRARVLPALAGTQDTTLLLRIIAEETRAMFGAQAPTFIKRIRARFEAECVKVATPAGAQ